MDFCDISFIIPRLGHRSLPSRSSSSFELSRPYGHDRSRTQSTATSISNSPHDSSHLLSGPSTSTAQSRIGQSHPASISSTSVSSTIVPHSPGPSNSNSTVAPGPIGAGGPTSGVGMGIRERGTRRSTASSITVATDASGTSATTALTTVSATPPPRTAELHEACVRLTNEVMTTHHCMVSLSRVDGNGNVIAATSGTGYGTAPGSGTGVGGPRKTRSTHSLGGSQGGSGSGQALTKNMVPMPGTGMEGTGKVPLTADDGEVHVICSGPFHEVMAARGQIMREHPFAKQYNVKVPRKEILDARGNMKPDWKNKMDEISAQCQAHLTVKSTMETPNRFGLETERSVEISISGPYESVEQAKVKVLVTLDTLDSMHSDVTEIDYKLHNIIAGRKRGIINDIQRETSTNIYFPTPLSGVLDPRNTHVLSRRNLIFITGDFFGVQRARDALVNLYYDKTKKIISRDATILCRKIDWLLTDKLEEVRGIMNDNGTFVNFPLLGSGVNQVTVYGEYPVQIERTLRAIMALVSQYMSASIYILPPPFPAYMPHQAHQPIPRAQIPGILKQIVLNTGAEAVFKSDCFELHGTDSELRQAVQTVLNMEIMQNFQYEVQFHIELANEHKEFFNGKKNGKVNKIQKMTNTRIKCQDFNDWNFVIELIGTDPGVLQGIALLQDELPAEMSFYVPEAYHKRIIGVSGKNIQRIMKKFDVYVKFSNAEEFALLGGYGANEDNVVVRTPAKNARNLDALKQAVMEMVSPKDKDFTTETVTIPRKYHRKLSGEKQVFLRDIEQKTNCHIAFPNKESASDVVNVFGPESQANMAVHMLLDLVPYEAEYRLPHSEKMAKLVISPDFVQFLETIKHDYNITVMPWVDRSGSNDETVIRFSLNRAHVDFLGAAKDAVEEYLLDMQVELYPNVHRNRANSYDSFQYFPTKLLPSMGQGQGQQDIPEGRATSAFGGYGERTLRAASSTPDIKALFDAPGYGTGYQAQQQQQPPPEPEYAYYTPFPQHRPTVPEYQYYAPRQPAAYAPPMSAYPMLQHAPVDEASALARASDPRLGEQYRRPRTLGPRAQSLDLSHAVQAQAQAAAQVVPPMPPLPSGYRHHPGTSSMSYGVGTSADQLAGALGQMRLR